MARPLLAEGRIVTGADSGGDPHSSFFIEHRIVDVGLTVPDRFVPPIWRRRSHFIVAARWSFRIVNRHLQLTCRGAHWVENRQIIYAELSRSIDEAVGVEHRIPLVGGDLV